MKFDATREKTRLWLLLLVGVVATLLGQTHARQIFAPSPHESGIFAAQTQASTGEIYDVCRYDAPDSLLAANSGRAFPSGGDRLLGSLGPAQLNHADELANTVQRIQGAGGTVEFRAGTLAFSPTRGAPGKVILDPNASISAVRHEAGHFFDDIGLGSPGMGYYMQNPSVRWASEYSSYMREIRAARLIGERDAARALLWDARAEKTAIFGR